MLREELYYIGIPIEKKYVKGGALLYWCSNRKKHVKGGGLLEHQYSVFFLLEHQ